MTIQQRVSGVAVGVAAMAVLSACGSGVVVAAPPAGQLASSGVTTIGDVFGSGCGRLPHGDQPGSLTAMADQTAATAIATNPQLSDFATALRSNKTDLRLNGDRPITVFVPDNDAFNKLHRTIGDDAFTHLSGNYSRGSFLPHLVVNQRFTRDTLTAAGTVQALDGDRLTIAEDGSTITAADPGRPPGHVVCGNIPTSNATVFIIDTVLVSPESQLAHTTPQKQVHCAPNPNAHDNAELCFNPPEPTTAPDTPRDPHTTY